ncbi:PAS domain-containing protein [Photobacterium leiognathi]|uniref:PAS domain-containing protein n=1 Tax=Photobacterium leiognathi TaxID=553611 RepID=UPI002733D6EC|nr:PAS domain-containing protein [Photobacterium leiognathi]
MAQNYNIWHYYPEQKLLLGEVEASQRVAKLGNWQWDVLTNTYTWSKKACRIYELQNCLHPDLKFVHSSIHPEDRERVITFMNNIITSEHTGYNIIYRLLLPIGKTKYIRKESVLIKDDNGKTTLIRGIIQDISEFYHISTELSKTSDKLHITYNAVAEGVWEYHFNTREKVTSPKVWDILKIEERVIHSLYELMRLIHKDERKVVLDAIRKLRNNDSQSLCFDFRLNPKYVTNISYIEH